MKNPKWVLAGKKSWETRKRNKAARHRDFLRRFAKVEKNEKQAVIMAKVRIRQAVIKAPWPHWHLLTFPGPKGGEARGVVDMIAIRKDHGRPYPGTKRGDTLQIILIQVKGGHAAKPTDEDRDRLRKVAERHGAYGILLATWQKGKSARFFTLCSKDVSREVGNEEKWLEVDDLTVFFGKPMRS
jgi:hypothetical protein